MVYAKLYERMCYVHCILGESKGIYNEDNSNTELVSMTPDKENDKATMNSSVLTLIIKVFGCATAVVLLCFFIIYIIQIKHIIPNSSKSSSCSNNHQPTVSTSIFCTALTTKFNGIFNRTEQQPQNTVLWGNDESNKNNNANYSATVNNFNNKNGGGHSSTANKCQKVLVVSTSGKNGIVSSKSICSTKLSTSISSSSSGNFGCSIEEDSSAKRALLN